MPTFPDLGKSKLPSQPLDMHMTPDGTAWWIAGMAGEIIQVRSARHMKQFFLSSDPAAMVAFSVNIHSSVTTV